MRHSRICISPFGYGEICWRDFEAILCGCLVVKPDMSHVETNPSTTSISSSATGSARSPIHGCARPREAFHLLLRRRSK